MAASINQQTHTEPTTTTISTSTSTSTPTPTELRPDEPTATELVLAEDKSEDVWRTSLQRSIEALEVDLKQKEREAHSIKKNYNIKGTVVILFPTLLVYYVYLFPNVHNLTKIKTLIHRPIPFSLFI